MRAFGENFGREELGPVDRWRAIEAMAASGWTDDAVATALNLSPRNIAQLRLLAHICPAMLDQMARGDMPTTPITGPLIVESYDTTVVVPPRVLARADAIGNIILDLPDDAHDSTEAAQ